MRAFIDGTIAANGRLTRMKVLVGGEERFATDVVALEALEIIERYEDRVDLIVGVLARMRSMEGRNEGADPADPPAGRLLAEPTAGEGRSSAGSPIDAADEVWRRIDIRARSSDPAASTRRARVHVDREARPSRTTGRARRAGDPRSARRRRHRQRRRPRHRRHALRAPDPQRAEGRSGFRRAPPPARRREHRRLPVGADAAASRRAGADAPARPSRRDAPPVQGDRERPLRRSTAPPATTPSSSATRRLPSSPSSRARTTRAWRSPNCSATSGWNVESLIWDTTATLVEPAPTCTTDDGGGDAARLPAGDVRCGPCTGS